MTPNPDTVSPETTVLDALKKMNGNITKKCQQLCNQKTCFRGPLFEFTSFRQRYYYWHGGRLKTNIRDLGTGKYLLFFVLLFIYFRWVTYHLKKMK
jgi:CBS domain-containing protein